MENFIPKGYHSALNLHDTQVGIKTIKDFFQNLLAERLNLLRVSAPLFVDPASGLNDNLNGIERPVRFGVKDNDYIDVDAMSGTKRTRWFDVQVRVHPDFRLEMHVDTDDANAVGFKNGSTVTPVK